MSGAALESCNEARGLGGGGNVAPEDRRVILSLAFVPGRGREGSPEDVLGHFGTADGRGLGLSLLGDAAERHDGLDVEMALIVCATFGLAMDHLELLVALCSADWHHSHENVVAMLGELRTPAAVGALYPGDAVGSGIPRLR